MENWLDTRLWRWEAKEEAVANDKLKVGEKINVGYMSANDKHNYMVGTIKSIRANGKQVFVEMPDGEEICV